MEPDGLTGRRLAHARKDAHLSQLSLATELGVSVRTLQNYEAGKFIPYRHLDVLSKLLGRNPSWLLYGHEQPEADQLLARSRRLRAELEQKLHHLVDVRDRVAESAGRLEAAGLTRED